MSTPTAAASPASRGGTSPAARWPSTERLLLVGLAVLVVLPVVIALVALSEPRWYPSLELAQTEMHVRDVGTGRTPLTGLIGRLGMEGERGSHPGPLGFYALAPVYRLLGSSSWALQASAVALHLSAVGMAMWIARRRGGMRLVIVVGVMLLVLLRFFGAGVLTEPWNPYLPLLWWVVFLLAVWSVVERDLVLLPALVVGGSLCAQTHISYVGLVGGLGAGTLVWLGVAAARHRSSGDPRPPLARWWAVAAGLAALVWMPPMLEELRDDPGNLSLLARYFTERGHDSIGLIRGLQLLSTNLDPWRLLTGEARPKVLADGPGWSVNGVVFIAVWAASAAVARRLDLRSVLRLDVVILAALGLGAISTSRIFGLAWNWLLLWAWGLTAVIAIAVALTASLAIDRLREPSQRAVAQWSGLTMAAALALCASVQLAIDASGVQPNDVATSRALATLVPQTLTSLEQTPPAAAGREGGYLITWTDPFGVVGDLEAFGLANELTRADIEVGFEAANRLRAAPYLTIDPVEATAVLRVVTGAAITEWEERDDVRLIARYDPRSADERALQDRLRGEIDEELGALGLTDLIPQIDRSFIGAIFAFDANTAVPDALIAKMVSALGLGTPSAVFLEPVGPPAVAESG